jgi:glycosyltransferase involved in cell wall biosynthesis
MNDILVSVLIPMYNHEKYILDCLKSVLIQGHKQLELIIIDDGSTDLSCEIANKWIGENESRFARVLLKKQENIGISGTVDRLLNLSKGDYLTILASDDILNIHSISRRLEYLITEKKTAVFGDAIGIDEDGNKLFSSVVNNVGGGNKKALLNRKKIRYELIFNWCAYGSVLMFKRDSVIIDGTSIINKNLYSEDMQLYYHFTSKNMLGFIDYPICLYRMHGSNTSRNPSGHQRIQKNLLETRLYTSKKFNLMIAALLKIQAYGFYYRHKIKKNYEYLFSPFYYGLIAIFIIAKYCYKLNLKVKSESNPT